MPAMDTSSTNSRGGQRSALTPPSDRILDRKIERRALPEGFSSNLGRKMPSSGRKVSDRSVRVMVRLFEESTGTGDKPTLCGPKLASNTSDRVSRSDEKATDESGPHGNDGDDKTATRSEQPQLQPEHDRLDHPRETTPSSGPLAQIGYQIEEYSLTLLKHKSYFNNRPLARCLDDTQQNGGITKIQRVRSRKEFVRRPATQQKEDEASKNAQIERETKDSISTARDRIPSPVEQLDDLMSQLLTWRGLCGSSTPNSAPRRDRRHPTEIESFWSNVRRQLWVDDDEIYQEKLLPAQRNCMCASERRNDGHTLDLSTSAPTLPLSYHPVPGPTQLPPPVPTRLPPPVPTAPQQPLHPATPAPPIDPFSDPDWDYPAWDQPSPSSVRLSVSDLGGLDTTKPLFYGRVPTELPTPPDYRRPLPVPPTNANHSRKPSSGPWIRPPTWRSLSSPLGPASPPPSIPPPPPPSTYAPATQNQHCGYHYNRYGQHRAYPSASTATISTTHSIAVTDNSSISSSRRTPKTSTSSTTTRSTRTGSGTSTSLGAEISGSAAIRTRAAPARPEGRRLTTEEKLSEIDAFLAPDLSPSREDHGGWI
ncbi:uncharacterized protein B0T15DRAFT_127868 [Chaetomium strumarium]|uniref:Uncharacterized protein n=1 Tax=Chaetomium strumarium TaxID=1170767 RepID=A0AAJ0GZJ9_9PEZI|nr:hypothetical protein B0T15DRAFT_127868 [Chaetomium strumarium]